MNGKCVNLSFDEAIQVLRVLEEVVVSLDRLGSSSRDPQETSARIQGYLAEGGAWHRLSEARRVMTVAMDRELPAGEADWSSGGDYILE